MFLAATKNGIGGKPFMRLGNVKIRPGSPSFEEGKRTQTYKDSL